MAVSSVTARAGGRKFLLSILGALLTLPLSMLNAPGEAYIALAGIIGTFNGADAFITGKSLLKGVTKDAPE